MKRLIKVTALIVASVMLCASFSFAAEADTSDFAAVMMQNKLARISAPIIYTLGDAAELCKNAQTAQEAEQEEIIDRGHTAYVVSAYQRLNMETDKYYACLTLINETGLFTVQTVDDVENYNFRPVLTSERVGKMTELEGRFVQFDMRKTDKIQKLELSRSVVQTSFSTADGFYLVNVMGERNGVLSFHDTSADIEDVQNTTAQNCRYHEDGHAIISIDDDSFSGSFLSKISSGETSLSAGVGNAVIQISEGEILRVFSFEEGYKIK